MAEWSNAPHSKCGVRVTVPGVRIPLFPLFFTICLKAKVSYFSLFHKKDFISKDVILDN